MTNLNIYFSIPKANYSDFKYIDKETLLRLADNSDDESDDAVVLAEAVIAPSEDIKPSTTNNNNNNNNDDVKDNDNEARGKRRFKRRDNDTEASTVVPVMSQKEKKLNNVFKVFNNKGKKRDKKNVRPPIKCGDDTILSETIKDAYINGNYGSHADRSPTEEEEDEENSSPLVQFKNLAADPDLAGYKVTGKLGTPSNILFLFIRNEIQEHERAEEI